MRYEWVRELARKEGFEASVIDTDEIVFDEGFRRYCEENLCGQYQNNYTCPPDCGTPDQMRRKVLGYSKALVVKSKWDKIDWCDVAAVRQAKRAHNEAMLHILAEM